jgi:hypothetical protein
MNISGEGKFLDRVKLENIKSFGKSKISFNFYNL